jgi:AmmeMemoRadiSam system protein A
MGLSEEEKGVLLLAARDSLKSIFMETGLPEIDFTHYPNLRRKGQGAFVTLKIDEDLRGCIGYLKSDMTLYDTVCEATKQASLNDPRFYPLQYEELETVRLEISILSTFSPIGSYDEIQIGVHGLVLDDSGYRGVLLPQVAVEHNYDVNAFLSALCEKAGMPAATWETEMLNIQVFTAVIISEVGNRKKTYERN